MMTNSKTVAPAMLGHARFSRFALIAPVVAWLLQHLLNYCTSTMLCSGHRPGLARGIVIAIDLAALTVCAAAGVSGYKNFRHVAGTTPLTEDTAQDHDELLAIMSVFLGVIGVIAVFWGMWPALVLSNVCGARQ
jgi:hypothetical protein